MSSLFKIFSVLVLFGPALSFAQTQIQDLAQPSKVEAGSIKLLGRGIENKDTHETISLACVDENCLSIRLVYFPAGGREAWFVGKTYTTEGEYQTEAQLEARIKTFSKQFRQFKRQDKRTNHYGRMQGEMWGVTGATVGLFYAATTSLVFLPVAAAVFVGGGAIIILQPGIFKFDPISVTFNDNTGWNWSSDPKRVSDEKFKLMLRFSDQQIRLQ